MTDRDFIEASAQKIIDRLFETFYVDGDVKKFAKHYLKVKEAILDAIIEVK